MTACLICTNLGLASATTSTEVTIATNAVSKGDMSNIYPYDEDAYDYKNPSVGTQAQFPLITSEYSKLGIDMPVNPECASGGGTVDRDKAYKNILSFCKDNAGKKPGDVTGLGFDYLDGTTKTTLGIKFDPACTPDASNLKGVAASDFALGGLIQDNCVWDFRTILDGW